MADPRNYTTFREFDAARRAEEMEDAAADKRDAECYRWLRDKMCYSFNGTDRTHYLIGRGRETLDETVIRRMKEGR